MITNQITTSCDINQPNKILKQISDYIHTFKIFYAINLKGNMRKSCHIYNTGLASLILAQSSSYALLQILPYLLGLGQCSSPSIAVATGTLPPASNFLQVDPDFGPTNIFFASKPGVSLLTLSCEMPYLTCMNNLNSGFG